MIIAAPATTTRWVLALLACGLIPAQSCRADELVAADFVVTYVDKKCDDVNNSWLITNKHTYLSIQVTLQWQAVGGKQKEEIMVLSPNERRPVGCAPTVQLVSAKLMEF